MIMDLRFLTEEPATGWSIWKVMRDGGTPSGKLHPPVDARRSP